MLRSTLIAGAFAAAGSTAFARPARGDDTAAPTLAPLQRYGDWLGARPTAASFAGRVVVVDVFTFGCANCQNVLPTLRALYRKQDPDLEIVGIHTPETPYETIRSHVVGNLGMLGVVWPVAIDNDHVLWNAYDIGYWPTQLIFDRRGVLRKTVVGDSQDALVNDTVTKLLAER